MKHSKLFRLGLTAAILAPVTPYVFGAEADPQPQAASAPSAAASAAEKAPGEVNQLDTVIVTASPTAGGVKKLEASYSVTVANAEQMKMANPKATADLLKMSPGIWVETSGGQSGANVFVPGFPTGGDAPFFTNMINGTAVYGMSSLSFFETAMAVRNDETVERLEIVQGGPGAVFGPGQMGATGNFILKQGTDKASGSLGLTYGDEGLLRIDGFYGGKVADGWYASIGGFKRSSDGIRNPQFKADDGHQLTATLSHEMDNGSLMFWARTLNDKNQSFLPIPMVQTGVGKFAAYPGFDPLTSTYESSALRYATVPASYGGTKRIDMANGRQVKMNFFGINYEADFGDWHVLNNFVHNSGDVNVSTFISGPNPSSLSDFIAGNLTVPAGATLDTHGTPLTQSVIQQHFWLIQKHLVNTVNDLRISKKLFPGNTLTMGLYLNRYTMNDEWSLGNIGVITNTPNASPVVLSYMQNGQNYNLTDPVGIFNSNCCYNIAQKGQATNKAFYLSDSWKIGSWLLDLSGRTEKINATHQICDLGPARPFGTQYDLYNNAVSVCGGTWTETPYNATGSSVSAGANYTFDDSMSAYVRVNNGFHFKSFDDIREGKKDDFKIKNFEVGFKYKNPLLYADLSVYRRNFSGISYVPISQAGIPQGSASEYGSQTSGLNAYLALTPTREFKIEVVGNYTDGKYTDNNSCNAYTDVNGNPQCTSFNGHPLKRVPKLQYRLQPSYRFNMGWGDLTAWLNYEHVGNRYSDETSLQELGSYNTLGGGLLANIGKNWEVRLQGTNLTNVIAITEGNPRITGSSIGANSVLLARPIEGREINIGLKYKF